MSSTFSGFYVAKSGIQAAQTSLSITGQNMSNINTKGYTRESVDAKTVGSSTNDMRYASTASNVGGGVSCSDVVQSRDVYLDVRYRLENAKAGETDAQMGTLNQLESVFDEVSNSGLDTQFTNLISELKNLSSAPTDTVTQNAVETQSLLITQTFNDTSAQINEVQSQLTDSFQTDQIDHVNSVLQNIAHLNAEIKSADVSGSSALELEDSRNTLLDELSQYLPVEVSSKAVSVGGGKTVYENEVDLTAGGQKFNLINGDDCCQFSLATDASGNVAASPVTVILKNSSGTAVTASNDGSVSLTNGNINDYLTSGSFSGTLDMLNGKGNFAEGTESTSYGIGYYRSMLDNLAQSFANIMNQANSTTDGSYNLPLFTTNDGTTTSGITASNISISAAWDKAKGNYLTTSKNSGDAGTNILYMISLFSKENTYTTDGTDTGKSFFTGTFQECVTNISTTLGLQIYDVNRQNTTYSSVLKDIDTQRQSVSSVDVSEEGINLIMYNQALTASSRFMTTLDEALDTIINNMGTVGR